MHRCGRRSNNTDGEETVRKWKESKRSFVLVVPTHKLLQRHFFWVSYFSRQIALRSNRLGVEYVP